jgi:Protein of unknown function (DUF4058)
MARPFPGMDPFLEQPAYWLDFHSRFINCWCEAIADALPPQYEASLGERVYLIEHDPEARKLGYPDLAVTHDETTVTASMPGSAARTITLKPVTIPLTILEGPREAYIAILYQPDRSLVTTLELLSPTNKDGPGRIEYLAQRKALVYQKVHLVELDLLSAGKRLPLERPLPPADCFYLLSRGDQRPDCQVYSWTLRQPLPCLPVPLRDPDPDLLIDLGAVFTTAYDRGRFGRRLNYRGTLPTHLRAEDRKWVEALLANKEQPKPKGQRPRRH